MEKKNNSLVIILMGVIIVILAVLCVLFATDTINLKSNKSNNSTNSNIIDDSNLINNSETENNDNSSENNNGEGEVVESNSNKFDINNIETELTDIEKSEIDRIDVFDFGEGVNYTARDYHAYLYLNGDVLLSNVVHGTGETSQNYLEIHNVKEMIKFEIAGVSSIQMIYFLTNDGYVYSYTVGDSINNNFKPQKVENIKNATKLFIHHKFKKNAGGSWSICALIDNKKVEVLNSESV